LDPRSARKGINIEDLIQTRERQNDAGGMWHCATG
jgi:hypothetical protein